MDVEQELPGGNASGSVVLSEGTVRKPWTASTPSVHAFVEAIRASGVDAPAPLGRDELGRQVLEFVPGTLALNSDPLSLSQLQRVGSMVRAIHDASARFTPPSGAVWETAIPAPGHELVCHNDLAPWNLIVGDRWVFIDWDAAAPSTRLWDLAYAAQAFTLSDPSLDPAVAASHLSAFIDGYGADDSTRRDLPTAMHHRAVAMHELLRSSHVAGREPWGSMYATGHGAHWDAASRYVETHHALWSRALTAPAGTTGRSASRGS